MSDMVNFREDPYKTIINKLFTKELHKEFCGSYRITQLSSYLDGLTGSDGRRVCLSSPYTSSIYKIAGDILDGSLSECWIILLSQSIPSLKAVIEEALDEFEEAQDKIGNEGFSLKVCLEEFSLRVCQKVVQILSGYVADAWRDRSFASLRKALSGSKIFIKKRSAIIGIVYAVPGTVNDESPTPTSTTDKNSFYSSLDRPSPQIRLARIVDNVPRMVWNKKVLEKDATRFWQSYCDTFYGCPGYVAVFDLYCWFCLHLDLLPPRYADSDDLELLGTSTPTPEDEQIKTEIRQEVEDFLTLFTSEEKTIFCTLFEHKRMEEVAQMLGYKSPSGISRKKEQLKTVLKERVYQLNDREHQIIFTNYLSALCEKIFSDLCKKKLQCSDIEDGG